MSLFQKLFARKDEATREREDVLRALSGDVRKWVYLAVGPRADFDDILQDALIELSLALPSFRGESSLKTFAHRVVLRATFRASKRYRRHAASPLSAVDDIPSQLNPEHRAVSRQHIETFYAELSKMSSKLRDAFVLVAIEELSHEEAAQTLGIELETLRARLKRAKAQLQESMNLRDDDFAQSNLVHFPIQKEES